MHINIHGKESNVVEDVTFCSGEGHMKPNCPYKPQERDGDQKGRISKVNAGTTKVTLEEGNRPQERMPRLCSSQRPHPLPDPWRRSRCLRVWRRSQWSHQLRSSM